MATRFYIHHAHLPTTTFDKDASWNAETTVVYRRMFPFRNDFSTSNITAIETVTTNEWDLMLAQFISPPLAAQTITGTFHGAMMARENNSSANMRSQVVVRVIAPDGTVRGTLISADNSALANEWLASTTTYRSARFPLGSSGTSVTSVAALDGDRIVIEPGYRAHNTSSTSYSGGIRYGNGVTNTDVPSNDTTSTSTSNNPWFEFSQTLTFLDPEYDIYDDAADAVDALPDPLTERLYHADLSAFTLDPDDPAQFPFDYSDTVVTGWIRLDAPADGPAVLKILAPMGGHESWPYVWAYDEVPEPASNTGYILPYDNPNEGDLVIPAGEFRYLAVGTDPTWAGSVSDVYLIIRRLDAGTPTGDIKDDIADAVDVFPASDGTETVSETTNLTWFTTEADDPTEVADFTGNTTAYTGWLKLVVPSAASVTISIVDTTDAQDLMFFLYDEVPTAASEAIFMSDEDSPTPSYSWPYLPEIALAAGTYYLLIAPFEGTNWATYEGGYLAVRVRWEAEPTIEDFSVDAIVFRTIESPRWVSTPAYIDADSATEDDAVTLSIPLPTGSMQLNDLILLSCSVDFEGFPSSTLFTVMAVGAAPGTGFNVLANMGMNGTPTNDHRLLSAWTRWDGVSDNVRVSTISTLSTAKAGAVLIFREAGTPEYVGSTVSNTASTVAHGTTSYSVSGSDANSNLPVLIAAAWAGGKAYPVTWTPNEDVVERVDVTASANASLMVGTYTDTHDVVQQRSATPSAAEFYLVNTIRIVGYTTAISLQAVVQPGGFWPLDAIIAGPISTQHDRTRYHYGVTPAENIVSSQTYGAFPPGTTLQEVLEGLDDLITDLENQA